MNTNFRLVWIGLLAFFLSCSVVSADFTCSQKEFDKILLSHFKELVQEYFDRKNAAQEDYKLLGTGFWYAGDYRELLVKHKQNKRLVYFLEKNLFLDQGFVDGPFLTRTNTFTYELRPNVAPADAVKNFGKFIMFVDCDKAIQMAWYRALLTVMGEEQFNAIFSKIDGPIIGNFSSIKLARFVGHKDLGDIPHEGAHDYLMNHPLYSTKHIFNVNEGFHVLVSSLDGDNTTYIGFGLDPKGLTRAQINEYFVATFNDEQSDVLCTTEQGWTKEWQLKAGVLQICYQILATATIDSITDQNVWTFFEEKLTERTNDYERSKQHVARLKREQEELQTRYISTFIDVEKVKSYLKKISMNANKN